MISQERIEAAVKAALQEKADSVLADALSYLPALSCYYHTGIRTWPLTKESASVIPRNQPLP